ncbi:MAG: hypothetical protein U0Q12_25240 [Vicinamibacterales bacterium]
MPRESLQLWLLGVIAACLVYLCVWLTLSSTVAEVSAQSQRPGELTGPTRVVVVGWDVGSTSRIPVDVGTVRLAGPVDVRGTVSVRAADEHGLATVIAGYQGEADASRVTRLSAQRGLPVTVTR